MKATFKRQNFSATGKHWKLIITIGIITYLAINNINLMGPIRQEIEIEAN